MYSTRQYEFKHWTDLTIVDLSFVESPFFAASYAERCLNHDMKINDIVGNLSGSHFRSAFGAFPGRGTPHFRKWKEDFVRLVERGDILLVFKDGKKPFSPIARQEDEGVFPTNSDPVLAERLIARANPEPPPPPVLNGLLKDIPSLNGNLWWESVPAERRNYLPPPSKRSETPEIAQAEPDEATSLTEDEREEAYREFWEAKKQGDASAILTMEEKLGGEFYHSLETGGGGPFGKYYAIPKERAELMLEGLRVIERGSPIDDVRAFDNKIRNIRKDLINASSDPIVARRSIEVSSLEGLSERVALEDVGSFVTEIPPRLGELEEIYAGAITAVVGHPALMKVGDATVKKVSSPFSEKKYIGGAAGGNGSIYSHALEDAGFFKPIKDLPSTREGLELATRRIEELVKHYAPELDISRIKFIPNYNFPQRFPGEFAGYGKFIPDNSRGGYNELISFDAHKSGQRSIADAKGNVIVEFDPEILRNDAGALAIFTHEAYEINALKRLFDEEGEISLQTYVSKINGFSSNNYHGKAVLRGDQAAAKHMIDEGDATVEQITEVFKNKYFR
ncbi:hypothetical protein HCH_01616 [Hahella chejuensis KCTC 2396]|uniref:Uncharacterized protein n=1 Tax=Hahella chejuensis (strain KCTC 2396) TaxID=349521 RepID=Q2SLK1_HAHCH|nr:hypothetical protein [Hahella chejuensis]ABC28473.1 hypothetical protein HCH_01616 [Hahella chejuensis KCTC 2396]